MYNDNAGWKLFIYLLILGTIVVGARTCAAGECASICKRNGDRSDYTWTQGCYCLDEQGAYNPKDSREGGRR